MFLAFAALAQGENATDVSWDLVTEKSYIKVFTRTPEASTIKELRILADFTGSMDTLLTILNDAENYGTWVYKCAKAESIEPAEGYSTAYYLTTDFPFPMSDRDLVAKSNQWLDEKGRLHQHTICAPEDLPRQSDVVRIQSYEAKWVMEQTDKNKFHIEYISSVDPGGNIPAWVVNLAITAGPIKSFEALMKQVQQRSPVAEWNASR